MELRINLTIKYVYIILTIVPIIYLLIAICSYYSVLLTFGQVPSSEDFTYDLVKDSGKQFRIFPPGVGRIFIISWLLCFVYGVPTVTIVNGVLRILRRSFIFYKWHLLTMLLVYTGVLCLLWTEAVGWYFSYALD